MEWSTFPGGGLIIQGGEDRGKIILERGRVLSGGSWHLKGIIPPLPFRKEAEGGYKRGKSFCKNVLGTCRPGAANRKKHLFSCVLRAGVPGRGGQDTKKAPSPLEKTPADCCSDSMLVNNLSKKRKRVMRKKILGEELKLSRPRKKAAA